MSATATATLTGISYISDIRLEDAGIANDRIEYIDREDDEVRKELLRFLGAVGLHVPRDILNGYTSLLRMFLAYATVPTTWDGPDSVPPSKGMFRAAVIACLSLMVAKVRIPKPMLHLDGTIGVYWRRNNHYASIDFEDDGEHIWAVTDGTQSDSGTWRAGPGARLPVEFESAIS